MRETRRLTIAHYIVKINMDNIDSWAVDSGTISSGVWKGEDSKKCTSVTLTATGTTRINVLSMTYEK